MFWGLFCQDFKRPFYIWKKERAAQRKAAKKEINDYNKEHKINARIEQELRTAIRRLNINRNVGKPKPKWKFTEARGAMV